MFQKLIDSGWFNSRKIDTFEYNKYLKSSKYYPLKNAVLFYEKFGQLLPISTVDNCRIIFNVNYSLYDNFILDNTLKSKNIAPIFLYFSPVWKLKLILIDENSDFYFNCGTKIADNLDDLWNILLNKFIEIPIEKEVFDILQDNGWHENRKIDVKLLQEFKNKTLINGYIPHKYAVEFFDEFGDLEIKLKNNRLSTKLPSKNPLAGFYNNFGNNNKTSVPIGLLDGFPIFVDENSKFYYEGKFLGNTPFQMFQSIFI